MTRHLSKSGWSRIDGWLVLIGGGALLFTLATYFTELAQYSTADQINTLDRIHHHAPVAYGSNVTYVTTGILGQALEKILGAFYGPGAPLIGRIRFNEYLPYQIPATALSLILLTLCLLRFGRLLGWSYRREALLYVASAILFLNLPLLKAVCKILKYDSLSVPLSLLSMLSFAEYLQTKKTGTFYAAVIWSALAFFEKDSTIVIAAYLVVVEGARCLVLSDRPLGEALRDFAKRMTKAALLFCGIGYVVTPISWTSPRELARGIYTLRMYTHSLTPAAGLCLVALIGLVLSQRARAREWLAKARAYAGWRVLLWLPWVLLGAALLWQKNGIYLVNYLPEAERATVESEHLFVGAPMVGYSLTSLDKSALLTRAKVFFAYSRISQYVLPEAVLALLLMLPFVGLPTGPLAAFLTAFVVFYWSLCSYSLAPIDPKYILIPLLAMAFLAIAAMHVFFQAWREKRPLAARALVVVIALMMVEPALSTAPSYFGYLNRLRDKKADSEDSLSLGHAPLTWVGWGESLYPAVGFLERQVGGAKTKLGYDYQALSPPRYLPPGFQLVDVNLPDFMFPRNQAALRALLEGYALKDKIDFLLVSRVMAFRHPGPNYLARRFGSSALFADRRSGVEYAWLFRVRDLLRLLDESGVK